MCTSLLRRGGSLAVVLFLGSVGALGVQAHTPKDVVGLQKGVSGHLAFPQAALFEASPNTQAAEVQVVSKAPRAIVGSGVAAVKCVLGKEMLVRERKYILEKGPKPLGK